MLNQTAKERIEQWCKDEFNLGPYDETVYGLLDIVGEIVGDAVSCALDDTQDYDIGYDCGKDAGCSDESYRVIRIIEHVDYLTEVEKEQLIEAIE